MSDPRALSRQFTAITAHQADAIGALARLYMSTETLSIIHSHDILGSIEVESPEWRWLISENGRIAAEGRKAGASDAF